MYGAVVKGTKFSSVPVHARLISRGVWGFGRLKMSLNGKDLTTETGRNGEGSFGLCPRPDPKGDEDDDGGLVWTTRGSPGHTTSYRAKGPFI